MQCEVLKAVRDVLGLANYDGALKVLEKVKLIVYFKALCSEFVFFP